jgi:hypothetical protein
MNLKDIINDIEIVKEAMKNGDSEDAILMLSDLKEDLKIIALSVDL